MFRFVIISILLNSFILGFGQEMKTVPQVGHLVDVTALSISNDGKLIASGDESGNIVIWDRLTKQQIRQYSRHTKSINKLQFSPSGRYLVSGCYDKSSILWDLQTDVSKIISKHLYYVTDVEFHPSEAYVFTSSADFSLRVYRISDGASYLVKHSTDITSMVFSEAEKALYFGSYEGEVLKMPFQKFGDKKTEMIYNAGRFVMALELEPESNLLAVASTESFPEKDDKGYSQGTLSFVQLSNHEVLSVKFPCSNAQGIENHYIRASGNGEFVYKNQGKWKKIYPLKNQSRLWLENREKVSGFTIDKQHNLWITAINNKLRVTDLKLPDFYSDLVGKADRIDRVLNVRHGKVTVQYDKTISQWDLTTGRRTILRDVTSRDLKHQIALTTDKQKWISYNHQYGYTFFDDGTEKLDNQLLLAMGRKIAFTKFSPSESKFIAITQNASVYVYSTDNQATLLEHKFHASRLIDMAEVKVAFNSQEDLLAIATDSVYVFDLEKGELLWVKDVSRQGNHSMLGLSFSDGNELYVSEYYIRQFSKRPESEDNIDLTVIPPGLMSSDSMFLVTRPGVFRVFNAQDGSVTGTSILPRNDNGSFPDISCYHVFVEPYTQYFGLTDGRILIQKGVNGKPVYVRIGTSPILEILPIDPSSNKLLIVDQNSIHVFDPGKKEVVVKCIGLQNNGYLSITSDGYYLRSKNGHEAIAMVKGNQVFTAEQFDVEYHRPDIVLKATGLANSKLMNLYQSAYEKRLLYASKKELQDVPKLTILRKNKLKLLTKKTSFTLSFLAQAEDSIAGFQAWVNGIPVIQGSKGYELSQPVKELNKSVKIPLQQGENFVEIAVVNTKGIWSIKESLKIRSTQKPMPRKLLVIAISVSNYLDSSQNLKYAVKDGRDFCSVWKKDGKKTLGYPSRFAEVNTIQLFNQNATRENILTLKSEIDKLTTNDLVMLYVSGHGLLDDQKKFWFATHDVDFSKPELRGIAYSELESLLDGVSVQNKVMFLDACHSGLSDSWQSSDTMNNVSRETTVVRYASKGGKSKSNKVTSNIAYEQMNELFNNLSRGSGTAVISASAGNSYAYESDIWENGVFTYCLINGIKNRAADSDKDGEITITELSNFVSIEVERLTEGNQKPNDRQENLYNNFRIW